jgi:hypothetical protein
LADAGKHSAGADVIDHRLIPVRGGPTDLAVAEFESARAQGRTQHPGAVAASAAPDRVHAGSFATEKDRRFLLAARSLGRWDAEERAVELVQARGKKIGVMGRSIFGVRYLWPEEALFLLDEGSLLLIHEDEQVGTDDAADASGSEAEAPSMPAAARSNLPAAPPSFRFRPFETAYMFLLRQCVSLGHYLVYSNLRNAGLVVFRHTPPHATASAAAPAAVYAIGSDGCLEPSRSFLPAFDVYARDGLSAFKPSAPGSPDFYVVVIAASARPPSATEILGLQSTLAEHASALQEAKHAKDGMVPAGFPSGRGAISGGARGGGMVAAQHACPPVQFAIVNNATITYYGIAPATLLPPARLRREAVAWQQHGILPVAMVHKLHNTNGDSNAQPLANEMSHDASMVQ